MRFEDAEEMRMTLQKISMEKANEFLELKRNGARTVANATSMCILSPILLIIMGAFAEDHVFAITETFAVGIGLIFLFIMIASAVYLFITYGFRKSQMEYLERDDIEVEDVVCKMIHEKKESYEPIFIRGIAGGVVLCILSVIPIILAGIADAPDFICGIFVGLLLAFVASGVNIMIRVSMVNDSYNTLLEEGEFCREEKKIKRTMDIFSSIYWCLITAVYLGWSLITMRWDTTWKIWPVAGVLYAAVYNMIKMLIKV